MTQVKAPYNFVPLNDTVFFPPWADLVSHDVPFKNGLSGKIALKITAESPIFIGGKEEPIPGTEFKQHRFPQMNGRYYIPGSSIKGEIANILEILSFSKLRFYNDEKFSQRDWNNEHIYKKQDFAHVKGGWLRRAENGFKITYSTEQPGRISQTSLGENFSNTFTEEQYDGNSDEHKSALYKYQTYGVFNENQLDFNPRNFDLAPPEQQKRGKKIYIPNDDGQYSGVLIFTGQSSVRKDDTDPLEGKRYEFVFWNTNQKTISLESTFVHGSEIYHPIVQDFIFGQNDHNPNQHSLDWTYWKRQLGSGRKVPIFLTLKDQKLQHFGLSMLYKIPYEKSISELLPRDHHEVKKSDLCDVIFGKIEDNKLKGRLHFAHAFSNNATELQQIGNKNAPFHLNLSSPKAKYYPFYIQQTIPNQNGKVIPAKYLTYNDGKIAGRKRYPIRESNDINSECLETASSNITSSINPLKPKSEFNCDISFHNLLPIELGALLAALTFHGQENCFHSIGTAKSLGFGKVKFDSTLFIDSKSNQEIDYYLGIFENAMNSHTPNWVESEQMAELINMATPSNYRFLSYMELEDLSKLTATKINEQPNPIKGLPRYSKFINRLNLELNSFPNTSTLDEFGDISHVLNHAKSKYIDNLSKLLESKRVRIQELYLFQIQEKQRKMEELVEEKKLQKKEKALESGLSLLDFTNCRDTSDIDKKISVWLKTAQIELVPENDHEELFEILKTVYDKLNTKNKKKFKNEDHDLNRIAKWVGMETAIQWHAKISSEL